MLWIEVGLRWTSWGMDQPSLRAEGRGQQHLHRGMIVATTAALSIKFGPKKGNRDVSGSTRFIASKSQSVWLFASCFLRGFG
jgi:hypothetical protein